MLELDTRKFGVFLLSNKGLITIDDSLKSNFEIKYLSRILKDKFEFCVCGTFNSTEKKGQKFIVIPSWKNPRWFVPKNKVIIRNLGQIIKPTSFKSKIIWQIAKILNRVNLIDILFRDSIYVNEYNEDKLFLEPGVLPYKYVVYTGAPGIYQKFTIQEMTAQGSIVSFYKFGMEQFSKERIESEIAALKELQKLNLNTFLHPRLIAFYSVNDVMVIRQSPAQKKFKHIIYVFTELHKKSLEELDSCCDSNAESCFFLEQIQDELTISLRDFLRLNNLEVLNNIEEALAIILIESKHHFAIKSVYSHGDFTPWNILTDHSKLYIFDWEMAEYRIQLWDYFNFIYHNEILSSNFSKDIVREKLSSNISWAKSLLSDERSYYLCHLVYLVQIILHYSNHLLLVSKARVPHNLGYLLNSLNQSLEELMKEC